MVLDTSAIIAILSREPSADRLLTALDSAETRLVSAGTVIEASLVLLGRYGDAGEAQLDRFLKAISAAVVAVDEEQVALGRDAALRFGRGRHAAPLNFGDCFSYALSIVRDEPLLFVGDDFSKTDVVTQSW